MELEPQEEPMDIDPEANQIEGLGNAIEGGEGLSGPNIKTIVDALIPYLKLKDIKCMRAVSKLWNTPALENENFRRLAVGSIKTGWYKDVQNMDFKETIQWTEFAFRYFLFFRKSEVFLSYWPKAASNLSKLELNHCSLECDGFCFILNFCPNLSTLKMKEVKLRDLGDYHGPEGHALGPATNMPVPQPRATLVDLSFDSMYIIGECFMKYLVDRTGGLETISVVNCFNHTPLQLRPDEDNINDLFEDFIDDLVLLFRKNSGTLKTMTFKCNYLQHVMQTRLVEEGRETPDTFPFPHHLTTSFSGNAIIEAKDFYEYYCKDLQSFILEVMQTVEPEAIVEALTLVSPNLRKLRVSILGGITSLLDLDLSPVLPRFVALEKFNFQDRKIIDRESNRIIAIRHRLFPFRMHRGLGSLAAQLKEVLIRINSRVDITCLAQLPPTVTQLTLDGIVNFQQFFDNPMFRPGFKEKIGRLTKLEIKGPWLCPLGDLMKIVIKEAVNLESLVMTKCCLTDTDATGLCREAAADIRKSVAFALNLFADENGNGDDLDTLVENAPTDWDKKRNMRRQGFGTGQRSRLSDLVSLKHLDISHNVSITDVTLYDAVRLPNLKTLSLHSCGKITDMGMKIIPMHCPNLEVLNVKHCRRLSMYGLDQVIRGCRKLRTLYTTRIIRNLDIEGFVYTPSPNYDDIVKSCITTEFQDPNYLEADD